jgi:hypothetical protein
MNLNPPQKFSIFPRAQAIAAFGVGRVVLLSSGHRSRDSGSKLPLVKTKAYLPAVSCFAMLTICTRRFSAEVGSALFFRSVSP